MSIAEMPDVLVEEVENDNITLLPAAANKIRSLLTERKLDGHGLRVFVAGGGCSGMQYGMALEREPGEFDTVLETDGVKVFVDPTSMMYLGGRWGRLVRRRSWPCFIVTPICYGPSEPVVSP